MVIRQTLPAGTLRPRRSRAPHQRELGLRMLSPDREVVGGDDHIAEPHHVAAGFGDLGRPAPSSPSSCPTPGHFCAPARGGLMAMAQCRPGLPLAYPDRAGLAVGSTSRPGEVRRTSGPRLLQRFVVVAVAIAFGVAKSPSSLSSSSACDGGGGACFGLALSLAGGLPFLSVPAMSILLLSAAMMKCCILIALVDTTLIEVRKPRRQCRSVSPAAFICRSATRTPVRP